MYAQAVEWYLLYIFSYDSHSGGEREIQRTMLELLNQLDGFDSKGDVKVGLKTNTCFRYKQDRDIVWLLCEHHFHAGKHALQMCQFSCRLFKK